jgi:hypothetical protein
MSSRPPMIRITVLLLVIFSHAVGIRSQERGYLDATQVNIRQRQREPATGTTGGVFSGYTEGQMPLPQPLTLSLKISGLDEMVRGEAFDCQVQVRNASDHPLEIPWDLSPADIEPADPRASYQYQTAAIWLKAKIGDNRAVTLEGTILLFGTPSIASTMVKLQPGEWVRIKAKGRALSLNPNIPWPPPDLASKQVEGSLAATLTLYAHSFSPAKGGNSHEDSGMTSGQISSNTLTIRFSRVPKAD